MSIMCVYMSFRLFAIRPQLQMPDNLAFQLGLCLNYIYQINREWIGLLFVLCEPLTLICDVLVKTGHLIVCAKESVIAILSGSRSCFAVR